MSQRPVLGYWKIRGLAQPIRLLLAYAGQDFEDKYYECGPGPEYSRDCWFNEKFNLGLDFPNLPYYLDGDVKLTQSSTILRYVAQKHGVVPKTEEERIRMDLVLEEAGDLRRNLVNVSYSKDFASLKDGFVKLTADKLAEINKFLGSKPWFAGDTLTCADFVWYEVLDTLSALEPSLLANCEHLQGFVRRFQALPAIKQYIESDKFLSHPFNNKMASFGNV
jgi:glutathione S-transferase